MIVQKHRSSFRGSREPSLMPAHDYTIIENQWLFHMDKSVGSGVWFGCSDYGPIFLPYP
jgi:hypothetical protein